MASRAAWRYQALNLSSAGRRSSLFVSASRRYTTGLPALPATTLSDALVRQDPLRRIRFLPQNDHERFQTSTSWSFLPSSWSKPVKRTDLAKIYPDLVEIEAHLLPFWTVMYIGDTRKSATDPRNQTNRKIGEYGFSTGVSIAAVPVGHWSSGVVLPDHFGHIASRAMEAGWQPEATPDIHIEGSSPFLESSLWDPERAPLFAFGAPKAQRIARPLVQCQAKNTIWGDGVRTPELCIPMGGLLSYAVPTYRPVFKGLTSDGSTIFIDSAGLLDDVNRFKVEGECSIPPDANNSQNHLTVFGYFTRAYNPSAQYEERTLLDFMVMYDYRKPEKPLEVARLVYMEMQRTELEWDDPFIVSASTSVHDDAVDVWSYAMKRAMREPTDALPKGPSMRPSEEDGTMTGLMVIKPVQSPPPPPPKPPPRPQRLPPPRPSPRQTPPPPRTKAIPSTPPRAKPILPPPPLKHPPNPPPSPPKPIAPAPPKPQPTFQPIGDPENYYLALKIVPNTQYLLPEYNNHITAMLKATVRTLRERYHPDRQPEQTRQLMTAKSQQVAEAFEELNTLEKRIKYSEKS